MSKSRKSRPRESLPLPNTIDCWEIDPAGEKGFAECPFLSEGACDLPSALTLTDPDVLPADVMGVLSLIPACCPLDDMVENGSLRWEDEILGESDLTGDDEETKIFNRKEIERIIGDLS